jgi:diguanylate cyclase (GGDEF)-like protein
MLIRTVASLDRKLARGTPLQILAIALCIVACIGYFDYVTGVELSMSLFYLGPIAITAWYVGRWEAVLVAALSCLTWFVADFDLRHSRPGVLIWNTTVRLEVFMAFALLLAALRTHIHVERELAKIDSLTNLFSRRAFFERLEHDLALAQRRNTPISLAYLDLDDFKSINDTYGHTEGDRVLRMAGRVLKLAVRRVDTPARLGGDEFAVLLPDTDGQGARRVMSDLGQRLRAEFLENDIRITCSVGVITLLSATVSAEGAISAADALMYQVKRQGKASMAFSEIGEVVPIGAAQAMRARAR